VVTQQIIEIRRVLAQELHHRGQPAQREPATPPQRNTSPSAGWSASGTPSTAQPWVFDSGVSAPGSAFLKSQARKKPASIQLEGHDLLFY
jgi:hypothetical protein